jgi:hypothetical protein
VEAKAWQAFVATLLLERSKFGLNELLATKGDRWIIAILDAIQEPAILAAIENEAPNSWVFLKFLKCEYAD